MDVFRPPFREYQALGSIIESRVFNLIEGASILEGIDGLDQGELSLAFDNEEVDKPPETLQPLQGLLLETISLIQNLFD